MPGSHHHNKLAWDRLAKSKHPLALPANARDFSDPLGRMDSIGWLGGNVRDKKLLCLAAGGGKHSVLYATAGAQVTVVDISPAMLELDKQQATKHNLHIAIVETSMDDLSMLAMDTFDIVVQPVSTCYVPDISAVYQEVARVLHTNGVYISVHKQPTSLQADIDKTAQGYCIKQPYYLESPLPPARSGTELREQGTHEYLHRWEQLVGAMCRAGFVIEDLVEPRHSKNEKNTEQFRHRAEYIAPYVGIKARLQNPGSNNTETIWTPN